MKRKRTKLIVAFQALIIISILSMSIIILIFQVLSQRNSFAKQSIQINEEYNLNQKVLIHDEVQRVVDLIYNRLESVESQIVELTKKRSYEAYAIAQNIYEENRSIKPDNEIKKMIIDALRPVRFENGAGYYFIDDMNGELLLLDDTPELEGRILKDIRDRDGIYIFRDFIRIINESGEGVSSYFWTKPQSSGDSHKKISYIKKFEPYNWIIGTGLYVEDIEKQVKLDLLNDISRIRFGKDGYIFVNTLDGFALVANGNLMDGKKRLWQVFTKNVQKTKELFQKEYDAAIKQNGDYIYYSINKLGDSLVESPKTSFIYGIKEFNWLIGAGVYLDDVEEEIKSLQEISYKEMINNIKNTIIITLVIVSLFSAIFILLSRYLRTDFILFIDFFNKSSGNDVEIDLNSVRFQELYTLADHANKMQHEKYEVQEKLKERESKFRLLAENSKDMIFRQTFPDGKYDYISPASMDVVGYTPQEIINEPFHIRNSIHPDWRNWLEDKIGDINRGFVDETFEYQIINKAGETVWINQKNTLIKDDDGNNITMVGRLSDDTERKNIEDQLRHNYRMDAVGQIAGGVAHDFNNILGGIMNASQVLNSPKRNLDEKGQLMVDLIRQSAKRGSDLTSKLSSFSRKRSITLLPLDIDKIITETIEVLRESIDKNIELLMVQSAHKSTILGDSTELHSVFLNLIINASHAINDSGSIVVETTNRYLDKVFCDSSVFNISSGDYIQIEVKDSGSGIKKEYLSRIFEPFFSTKEQGKGTGLGLATVYGAVLDHHGVIFAESEIGAGTSFFILLPLSVDKIHLQSNEEYIKPGIGCILVVDDNEIIRVTSKDLLEDMGYSVLLAEDGLEAIEVFSENQLKIDLIIMDMLMPKMNGAEAFYKIREFDSDCKVIIASGFTKEEDMDELRNRGLSGFLKKPFSDVELGVMIDEILNT